MATSPVFASAFKVARVRNNAAANTASDGSGTVAIFQDDTGSADYTAPAAGARVDRITIINSQATAAASSAMVIRVFYTNSSGANFVLLREVALAAATRSVSVVGVTTQIVFAGGFVLASGEKIGVVQSVYAGVQDTMSFTAEIAELT